MAESHGRRLLSSSASETLLLEREPGRDRFGQLDAISGRCLVRSLEGQRVGSLKLTKSRNLLILESLTSDERSYLRELFLPAHQQARGAWYLPPAATVKLGRANLPHYYEKYPRFASGLATDETAKVAFDDPPEAIYFWAVLQPLLDLLYRPILFRTSEPLEGTPDEQRQAWSDLEASYQALRLSLGSALSRCRYGSGWSLLSDEERLDARKQLLGALRENVTSQVASLYRILAMRPLVERYYARAKRGSPTLRKVVSKEVQPILTGYFGGDWLAFLGYIGEEPEAEERISTTLPEPKLYVQAEERAASVAAVHGVALEEINRMLGAFWSQKGVASPVRERVSVIREYWREFEEIHSRQVPGMPSLWGLVEEDKSPRLDKSDGLGNGPAWYVPGSYSRHLTPTLLADIDRLWEGTFLQKWPHRIVSTPVPHGLLASTLGVALRFWHGLSLTAWFASEGPYSRTEIADLQTFYAADLESLSKDGCPVEKQLFQALIAAERKLGKPTPFIDPQREVDRSEVIPGVTLETRMEYGSRRSGFEYLRDVITYYRSEWTSRHIERYCESRWNTELRLTATEFYKLTELKGREPNAKEFATVLEEPANHWLGGNACDVYAAFGARAPLQCVRSSRLLPQDIQSFMRDVLRRLGGKDTSYSELATDGLKSGSNGWRADWQAHHDRKRLAELSPWYVQLYEALERPPELAEFGRAKLKKLSATLHLEIDEVWSSYSQAVQLGLDTLSQT